MRKALIYGGYAAAAILVIAGIGMIVAGFVGQSEVRDRLEAEQITGTPDMKPSDHPDADVDCDVAEQEIDTGDEGRCFAKYMRLHALEATGGQTYAELPRFLDEQGNPTSEEEEAAVDPETGAPRENPARETWVTFTALSTALNTSFFAESVAQFSIAVGAVLIVIGIGLFVLAHFALAPWVRRIEEGTARAGP